MQEWQIGSLFNLREISINLEDFSADFCNHSSPLTLQGLGLRFADQAQLERRFGRKHLSYDAYIVKEGLIPTRAGNLHDFFNFQIWKHLPLSKSALHRRQWQYQEDRASIQQKNRGRHEDRLTLFDEGGAVLLPEQEGPHSVILFGHALWESMFLDNYDVSACAFQIDSLYALNFRDLSDLDQSFLELIQLGFLEKAEPFGLKIAGLKNIRGQSLPVSS